MEVGMELGKVKKFGIGWCIPHRMAADDATWGGSVRPFPPGIIKLKRKQKKNAFYPAILILSCLVYDTYFCNC